MAITRASRATLTAVQEVVTNKVIKKTKIKSEKLKTETPRSPKKKSYTHPEDALSHIEQPSDLSIPPTYREFHEPEFLKGVEHLLTVDPTLWRILCYRNFPSFGKDSEDISVRNIKNHKPEDVIVNYWQALVNSVIGQQISGLAAESVRRKFVALFDGKPTPAGALAKPFDELRSAGLSNQKTNYVVHISEVFASNTSPLTSVDFYINSTTQEIIDELVKLKGIGVWLAKMFCAFTLKELDVFAEDDLGVARGVARYFEKRPELAKHIKAEVQAIDELKALLKKKGKFEKADSRRDWVPLHDQYVIHLGKKFAPYQLIAMLAMWRLSTTNTAVFEHII